MDSNEELVEYLKRMRFVHSAAVERAFRETDRAAFVPGELLADAFEDRPLPTRGGQTVSAPGVVAVALEALDVRPGMKVLDVGSGSGYQAALLSKLVGGGKVFTIELLPELVDYASARIKASNVRFVVGDGSLGLPEEAPFDRVVVAAACPRFPKPLVEQLKEGGRIVAPVGTRYAQDLLLGVKEDGKIRVSKLMSVVFVPLLGEESFK